METTMTLESLAKELAKLLADFIHSLVSSKTRAPRRKVALHLFIQRIVWLFAGPHLRRQEA
jgi:hypothetical protein